MSKDIRKMINIVKNYKQFVNENVENDRDRSKIKSQLFFVSNTYKNNEGEIKYIELKPFKHNIVDKIFVYSNSVVFYGKNGPIDVITNINMDSNNELVKLIENRLNDLEQEKFLKSFLHRT